MKKKLTVLQIVLILVSFGLPYIDGMFSWGVSNSMYQLISRTPMSLDNMMNIQLSGFCSVLFWTFLLSLASMLLYLIVSLFKSELLNKHMPVITLSGASVVINMIMIIIANYHRASFKYNGEHRNVSVTVKELAYIALIVLVAIWVVELYKKLKCAHEQ
jgi:hypothetical protein